MMSDAAVQEAAKVIANVRLARDRLERLPSALEPPDEAAAYLIQAELHRELETRGNGDYAGHKIGCTTPVMQRFLGIDSPSAGGILRAELHQSPAIIATRGTTQFGVECEVAVRIDVDLPPRPDGRAYGHDELIPLIRECLATIEIVENRYVDYGQLSAATLIADDFFGAGLVLGQARTDVDPGALDRATATMSIDDVIVGEGRGSDILDHPLNALAWLANSLNDRGSLLQAGEIVTLGSLVATHWVEAGSQVRVDNDLLGSVEVSFVEGSSCSPRRDRRAPRASDQTT